MTATLITPIQFKRLYDDALELRQHQHPRDAVRILKELEGMHVHRPAVIGMLGTILLYDLEDVDGALPYLRESVSLSPRSEVSSIALFHAWIRKGERAQALREAKRFVLRRPSDEYSRLLATFDQLPSRPRVSCFLLIDASAEMAPFSDDLCRGLQELKAWLGANPSVREQLDLVLITFGGYVRYATNFARVVGFSAPPMNEPARRPLARALSFAAASLEQQLNAYDAKGLEHRTALVVTITCGGSDGEPRSAVEQAAHQIRLLQTRTVGARSSAAVYPVLVGSGDTPQDLEVLCAAPPSQLRNNDFSALFRWLAHGFVWATASPLSTLYLTPADLPAS